MPAHRSPLPNTFRRKLLNAERLIGCWASLANPISTEILGYAGFDWLLLDAEHAPNDLDSLSAQLLALGNSPTATMVRPQWADPVILKRLLDAGFYNFLMPFIESAELAREAVAATRYPPRGTRGISVAHRSNQYGACPNYFETINDNLSVVVQIESDAGLRDVDAIASVKDVDGLFVGPSDLSAALGHFGNPQHPDVQQAIRRVAAAARAQNKPSGILATVPAQAQLYLDLGMSFVAVGVDVALLRNAAQHLAQQFPPTTSLKPTLETS